MLMLSRTQGVSKLLEHTVYYCIGNTPEHSVQFLDVQTVITLRNSFCFKWTRTCCKVCLGPSQTNHTCVLIS